MKKTKLVIFDFDGTLVDTPLPEDGRHIFEKKTGKPWKHEGWWAKEETLDLNIFDIPTIPMVIEAYDREVLNENSHMVMLTGRLAKRETLVENVMKVLEHHNLKFDEYHFNNGGKTEVSKYKTLLEILNKNQSITEIEMFEDRDAHIGYFTDFCNNLVKQGRITSFNIVHVPSNRH